MTGLELGALLAIGRTIGVSLLSLLATTLTSRGMKELVYQLVLKLSIREASPMLARVAEELRIEWSLLPPSWAPQPTPPAPPAAPKEQP